MREPLRADIERAARKRGVSMNAEMGERLEQSFAELAYPPEIGALAELFARLMAETCTAITGANRWSGHGLTQWANDPYAFDQVGEAVLRVLLLSRPSGSRAPHGLFAMPDYPKKRAHQIDRQIADGTLQVMFGRHQEDGLTAARWIGRVREKLGAIGDRLERQPEPDDYFVSVTKAEGSE